MRRHRRPLWDLLRQTVTVQWKFFLTRELGCQEANKPWFVFETWFVSFALQTIRVMVEMFRSCCLSGVELGCLTRALPSGRMHAEWSQNMDICFSVLLSNSKKQFSDINPALKIAKPFVFVTPPPQIENFQRIIPSHYLYCSCGSGPLLFWNPIPRDFIFLTGILYRAKTSHAWLQLKQFLSSFTNNCCSLCGLKVYRSLCSFWNIMCLMLYYSQLLITTYRVFSLWIIYGKCISSS